jgi:hypothetical protein
MKKSIFERENIFRKPYEKEWILLLYN